MSVGLIKSGGYVPCGASATLMSQYPMTTLDSAIDITSAMINAGFTAPSAGVLFFHTPTSVNFNMVDSSGVSRIVAIAGSNNVNIPINVVMNKGDVITSSASISSSGSSGLFRPFAVGEVL